jgi:hypothetical protein
MKALEANYSFRTCDNDVFSPDFESKLDPYFTAGYVTEYGKRRRRALSFDEEKSGLAIPKKRINARLLGTGMMPTVLASEARRKQCAKPK